MLRKQTKKQDLAAAMPPGQKKIKNELQAASNEQQATGATKRTQLKGIK
jgi:hypothetical protein